MQTPVEQILSSFEGLTIGHFLPVLIVSVVVAIILLLRRGKPKSYTWSSKRGWQPLGEGVLANADPEKLKDVAGKLGLSETDLEDLKRHVEAKSDTI